MITLLPRKVIIIIQGYKPLRFLLYSSEYFSLSGAILAPHTKKNDNILSTAQSVGKCSRYASTAAPAIMIPMKVITMNVTEYFMVYNF